MLEIVDVVEKLPRNPHDPNWKLRRLADIARIVVHYDEEPVPGPGTTTDGPAYEPLRRYVEQARYHIRKNWNDGPGPMVRGFGLMHHYRVSADGKVWRTQPEELVTWHARAANWNGLAICCDLGPGQKPAEAQLEGLEALLLRLCYHRPDIPAGRGDVWGHVDLRKAGNSTRCPGLLLEWVRAFRAG
ncbi:MAG TPA: peptidoglycan recognition family protein [Chloroflexia bacterium]|nr:peptidoglycan recognition family protein [Chloroflexia bacterium]